MRRILVCAVVLTAAGVLMLTGTGCTPIGRITTTQIQVQVSGERLLHLATVPRVLPDGGPVDELVAELLEAVAMRAGGYTYIEKVMGAWVPPGTKDIIKEENDLLLVAGPPEMGFWLRQRLHRDFDQEEPFVISLPIQSIAVVKLSPPPAQVKSETTETGGPTVRPAWKGID